MDRISNFNNATIVYDHNNYEWGDRQWMDEKTERQSLDKPMSVYESTLDRGSGGGKRTTGH